MSAIWFAADLHLRPGESPEGAAFARLLKTLPAGDALWLLGDVFEYWAGRGHARSPDYRATLEALRAAAARGVRIRFLAGNRDFLLDEATQRDLGFEPFSGRETLLEAQGRRTYLAHGDYLCPGDKAYLRAAAVLRHPATLALARALPFAVTERLAARYRRYSEAKRSRPAAAGTYDLSESLLADAAARHGATDLVIGHVHRPVDRPVAGSAAALHVLDPWHGPEAPFLRLEDGRFSRGRI